MFLIHIFSGIDIQSSLLIILNLIVIESLLSADNAAVLATMVMDLPKEQRKKALKYGILGAYVFRGICLIFAYWLVNIWWLKPLGGIYLLYLSISYFISRTTPTKSDDVLIKKEKPFYRFISRFVSPFWSMVIMVEVMDLAFSIDNVFAAVAFTDNIYLIMIGVFIGILAMRFVAQSFVRLMEIFSFLAPAAFLVIGVLGLKLLSSLFCHFDENIICLFLEGEHADMFVSLFTVLIFISPVITSVLFNFPKKRAT